jgi:hypothetical protein
MCCLCGHRCKHHYGAAGCAKAWHVWFPTAHNLENEAGEVVSAKALPSTRLIPSTAKDKTKKPYYWFMYLFYCIFSLFSNHI